MCKKLIFLVLLTGICLGQQSDDLKIGIALRGGGALGFAHIGSLSVIDSLGIPIDYVAGTSMGGLVGGLYAIGMSTEEMTEFVLGIDWEDIFQDMPARKYLPYLIKRNSGRFQLSVDLEGLSPALPDGLVAGRKIYNLIFSKTYPFEGISSFDQLPTPFRCVGADIVDCKEIIFSKGSLAKAMRTTMSIPTAFDPVVYGDSLIVDGGMLNNFPVNVAKDMGADFVIGLDLVHEKRTKEYYNDLLKILDRTLDIPREAKLLETTGMADLLIEQNIDQFSLSDFDEESVLMIIKRGKQAAYQNLDKLLALKKRLNLKVKKSALTVTDIEVSGNSRITETQMKRILHLENGQYYHADEIKNKIDEFNNSTTLAQVEYKEQKDGDDAVSLLININENRNPVPRNIRFEGNDLVSDRFILNFIGLKPGKAIDLPEFRDRARLLFGLGYFKDLRYLIIQNDDKTIDLIFEVKEKSPQKFLFGLHYDDYFNLVGTLGLRVNSVLIPGLYLESDLQFSGLTRFTLDMYYPSRTLEFPVYPILSLGYKSVPQVVYDSSAVRILQYDDRGWHFGGGIGLSLTRFLNFEGKLYLEYPDIVLDIGGTSTTRSEIKDEILAVTADLDLDLLDNVLIPNEGLKLRVFGETSAKTVGSSYNYSRLISTFDYYNTFAKTHTARIFAMYLRSWQDEPFYKTIFFVGGPKSFVGWDYRQAYGPQFSILRAEYRWQFLPGLYVSGIVNTALDYKLGLPESAEGGKALWGYALSFTYASLLGPVELYFSMGDKTPYRPGDVQVLRVYFMAGYAL